MRMSRTEKQKMLAGELYNAADAELQADMTATMDWLSRYNAAVARPADERRQLLVERFAAVGEDANSRPPFHCDYGFNISLGAGAFRHFNCVVLAMGAGAVGDG